MGVWRRKRCANFPRALIGACLWGILFGSSIRSFAQGSAPNESGQPGSHQDDSVAGAISGPNEPSRNDAYYSQPFDPAAPSDHGNIEKVVGGYKARVFGTLLVNFSYADSRQFGQDIPLWPVPGNVPVTLSGGTVVRAGVASQTFLTLRQSIIGFQMEPAEPSAEAWSPSGVIEFDFSGPHTVDLGLLPGHRVVNTPQLRRAFVQFQHGTWRILAGQEQAIVAPLDPVSLSHVAVPLGDSAGDLWARLPQVRIENSQLWGGTTVLFQAGVLKPSFRDPVLHDLSEAYGTAPAGSVNFEVRTRQPFYQGRIAFSRPRAGSVAAVGFGVHYGRENIVGYQSENSWAAAVDYSLPLFARLTLRGEAYSGSNLSAFDGGIIQGISATPNEPPFTDFQAVHDQGGWIEMTVPITTDSRSLFYAGAGTDKPRRKDLLPAAGRSRNSFLWASYLRRLGHGFTLAAEWSNWDFQFVRFNSAGIPGPPPTPGRGNVLNLALAYQF